MGLQGQKAGLGLEARDETGTKVEEAARLDQGTRGQGMDWGPG